MGNKDVFITGWFIVTPPKALMSHTLNEHLMDGIHSVGELVAMESNIGWENFVVVLTYIPEGA